MEPRTIYAATSITKEVARDSYGEGETESRRCTMSESIDIEADSVLRLVRNQEGYISETDGSYTYQLAADLQQGKLVILDEEWTTLGVRRLSRMSTIVPNIVVPT